MNNTDTPKRTQRVTRRVTHQAAPKACTIVVADDDPWILDLTRRHLKLFNYRVVGAARDGKEAVALAKQLKPDLVILDINMPGTDGIQAAREIQSSQNTTIIFSTGASDEATLRRLRELKIAGYLVKPFSPAQLKAALFMAETAHAATLKEKGEPLAAS